MGRRIVLDRALDGDDAHQTVALRDHGGHQLHALAGVFLKRAADLGVRFQQLFVVDQHLHDAGGEDLHEVLVHAVFFIIGAAENADPGEMLRQLLGLFHTLADLFGQPLGRALLAQTGGDGDVGFVVGDDIRQAVILGGVFIDLVDHTGNAADDLTELDDLGPQFCHYELSPQKSISWVSLLVLQLTSILENSVKSTPFSWRKRHGKELNYS